MCPSWGKNPPQILHFVKVLELHILQRLTVKTLPPWKQFGLMLWSGRSCTTHSATCCRISAPWDQLPFPKSLIAEQVQGFFSLAGHLFPETKCSSIIHCKWSDPVARGNRKEAILSGGHFATLVWESQPHGGLGNSLEVVNLHRAAKCFLYICDIKIFIILYMCISSSGWRLTLSVRRWDDAEGMLMTQHLFQQVTLLCLLAFIINTDINLWLNTDWSLREP